MAVWQSGLDFKGGKHKQERKGRKDRGVAATRAQEREPIAFSRE